MSNELRGAAFYNRLGRNIVIAAGKYLFSWYENTSTVFMVVQIKSLLYKEWILSL